MTSPEPTSPTGSRAPRRSNLTLPKLAEPPASLLDYLDQRFPRVGRATWRARLEDGKVSDHLGRALDVSTPYRAGLRVHYFREIAHEERIPFVERILHRDEHLLVADKPPFLPVTPGGRFVNECLLYRLQRSTGIEPLAPLHRLDRLTSGVVMFSLSPAIRGTYHQLFDRQEVIRDYVALARAPERPTERQWRIENRLVSGDPWFLMTTAPGPPNAITHIQLESWRDGLARFHLRPETGKTHQLRLHMTQIGYPILGDPLYPTLQPEAPPDYHHPLQLLARRLRFRDPLTGEERDFRTSQHLQHDA